MTGTWKATLGVLLVFVLGCAAGTLGTTVFFAHRTTLLLERGSAGYVDLVERRMTRHLDLDADQKQKVHQFLMQNLSDRKQLQARIQPDVQLLNLQTVREIRSVLRPEQVRTFHENLAEFRQRMLQGGREGNPALFDGPADGAPPRPAAEPAVGR